MGQLLRPLEIFDQFLGDPVGDIGARATELAALALLSSGPDHVAILIHQPNRGYRLMLALFDVTAFVLTDTESPGDGVAIAHTVITARTAAGAQVRPGVYAFARIVHIG